MEHPYSVKLKQQGKGTFPSFKGDLYERDVIIARVSRGAVRDRFVPPIEYHFYSDASRNRFDNFADCLSIGESIEALLPF